MARFGKGAAKVDLVLDESRFQLGDTVEGKLLIHGGEVEQKINKIDVKLEVIIRHGDTDHVDADALERVQIRLADPRVPVVGERCTRLLRTKVLSE